MPVVVVGLNHETAPVTLRERVAVSPEQLPRALAALQAVPGVREAAILSTCNRTELYVAAGPELSRDSLVHFLPSFRGLPQEDAVDRLYTREGRGAAVHLCTVAAGLDSAILGETQILAQVKEAYQAASERGTLGPYLHQLFTVAIATAKQVQTDTTIGLNPLSTGSVAVQVIRKVFAHPGKLQVLVLGTGKMGRLALRHLDAAGVRSITVASRSPARARQAAGIVEARCVCLDEVPRLLPSFHVVVTATSGPALGEAHVRAACLQREMPLLLIDLGVPRNVDPAVAAVPQVLLFNVDDLKRMAEANLEGRRQELQTALAMVERAADQYAEWVATRKVVPLIRSLREEAERIRQQERDRTLARLQPLDDRQWAAVEELTHALTGRLMHHFTINLKRSTAGAQAAVSESR